MYSSYPTSNSGANYSNSIHPAFTAFQPRMDSFIAPHRDPDQVNEMQSRWALLSEAAKAVQAPQKFGQRSSTESTPKPLVAASTSNIHNDQSARYNNSANTAKFTTHGQNLQGSNIMVNKRKREKSPDSWEQFKSACQGTPNDPGHGSNGYGSYSGKAYSDHSSCSSTTTLVNAEWNSQEAAYTLVDVCITFI